MTINKIYKKLVSIYDKHGQSGVYSYAHQNPAIFKEDWEDCEPCEDTTPTIRGDSCCSVCGSVRK